MRWKLLVMLVCTLAVTATAVIANRQQARPWSWTALKTPGGQDRTAAECSEPVFTETIYASGIVEGRRPEVPLRFEIPGRIDSVHVIEGVQVRKGEVLAQLDATVWQHELAQSEAALAKVVADKSRLEAGASNAELDQARAELSAADVLVSLNRRRYQRAARLAKSGGVAEEQLDDAESKHRIAGSKRDAARAYLANVEAPPREHEIQAAEAEIALRSAEVAAARAKLAMTELVAPSDGVVISVDSEPGELTGPDASYPVVTTVDRSQIVVKAYVEELDALRVKPGQRAYAIADGLPNRELEGEITSCSPVMRSKEHFSLKPEERMDVKTREIVIRLDASHGCDQLVVGLPVDVSIQLNPHQELRIDSEFLDESLAILHASESLR